MTSNPQGMQLTFQNTLGHTVHWECASQMLGASLFSLDASGSIRAVLEAELFLELEGTPTTTDIEFDNEIQQDKP